MGERTSNQMENLSIQTKNRSPRDLLQRFRADTGEAPGRSDPEEDLGSGSGSGEVELNLGLSLGGRFGVDKSDSKLVRSSSIAAILPVVRDDAVLGSNTGPGGSHSSLARTASLPVETEDEWRKRKELQSLRRLAAKRRRSEKQRRVNGDEREECVAAMRHVGSSAGPPLGSGNWVSGDGAAPATVESQGSVSELESGHLQGSSGSGCETSSLQEQSNQDVTGSSRWNPEVQHEPKCPARNKGKKVRSSVVEDMPCVFTKGDGPNGRRIEGILYKYAKGEQVKIMCVCHGSFLSPAEFVRHAGGTDVVHPLRHIVINPSSFS